MSYQEEWKAISARIQGLTKAGDLYVKIHIAQEQAKLPDSGCYIICEQCKEILEALDIFYQNNQNFLPEIVAECFKCFLTSYKAQRIGDKSNTENARFGLIALCAFETQISYLLSDIQQRIISRTELAFMHLQRSLAVDEALQARWEKAFKHRETECEKLGAIHLLLHGIFAFKYHSDVGRTDIIFSEPENYEPLPLETENRGVEGFVLTEWKLFKKKQKSDAIFKQAREQAGKYAKQTLTGLELRDRRYAVVVSLEDIPEPADININSITYRHINIAINKKMPSQR